MTENAKAQETRNVCPESTIESASQISKPECLDSPFQQEKKKENSSESGLSCESTVESANRRNFIMKAAVAGTALALGGSLLGANREEIARASGDITTNFCGPIVVKVSGSCCIPITVRGSITQTVPWQKWECNCDSSFANVMNNYGNLGIGTTSPSARLEVNWAGFSCFPLIVTTAYGVAPMQEWRLQRGGCYTTPVSISASGMLCFGASIGDKIYLYDGACNKFGFSIAASQLSIYHGASGACNHTSFGNYNGTSFTEFMRLTNHGNLGIGTTAPSARVHTISSGPSCIPIIAEGAACQSAPLQEWQNSGKSVLAVVDKEGNLGIGTSAPSSAVQLVSGKELRICGGTSGTDTKNYFSFGASGTFGIDGLGSSNGRFVVTNCGCVGIGAGAPLYKLDVRGTVRGCAGPKCPGVLATSGCASAIPLVATAAPGQTANLMQFENSSGTALSVVSKCGWFGIGTSTPAAHLCVQGSVNINGALTASELSFCSLTIPKGTINVTDCAASAIGVSSSSTSSSGIGVQGSGGFVGIQGVAGSASAVPLIAKGTACQTADLQTWQKGSTTKSVVNKCGWLGIGTTSPSLPLNVQSTTPLTGQFKSGAMSGDRSALVQFQNADSTAVDWNLGVAGECNAAKIPDGSFYFQQPSASTVGLTISKCGSVGIDNTSPQRKLCVNGRGQFKCGLGIATQNINTTLAVNGSIAARTVTPTCSTYDMKTSDFAVFETVAGATVVLPPAGTQNGMIVFIKNLSTGKMTVSPSGSDKIEQGGALTFGKSHDSVTLISNGLTSGGEWYVLTGVQCGAVLS